MFRIYSRFFAALLVCLSFSSANAQLGVNKSNFTHQDTLRGSITPERAWWNVISYHIFVEPDYNSKTISGWTDIGFEVSADGEQRRMQIDLQQPMQIDSMFLKGQKLTSYKREGNVFYIDFGDRSFMSAKTALDKHLPVTLHQLKIYFHGKAREAIRPPWDGGWIWATDTKGRPWMSVACQGLGASVWYPCKDYQGDEPDQGAVMEIKVPEELTAVSNGKMIDRKVTADHKVVYTWEVKNPINNYNLVPYIGYYVHWADTYIGENEKTLSLDYWVLDYNKAAAKKQFDRDVKRMLRAFEYWFGPYPFYEDGYKLVESPHLGMEHQSATAYGNQYLDGYLGMDLSGTGWGKKWDYIIVHESGHEWFANNITTNDIADMWVHEGFTMYSEVLFTEFWYGKEAGNEYCLGIRNNIDNDRPLIGPYGVNKEGSGDMYNKGANLLHTVRQVINNDSLFRQILRGLNRDFYHQTVDSKDVEAYISAKSGKDLSKIFDQYLRTVKIPVLSYKLVNGLLNYRWENVVPGFDMPVRLAGDGDIWIHPTANWQPLPGYKTLEPDALFYIETRKG